MQFGFMPGKGTIHALFVLRRIREEFRGKEKKLCMCFVNLKKAFDRVSVKVVEWALRKKNRYHQQYFCYCGWCCDERCKRRIVILEEHFCTLMSKNLEVLKARFQRWKSALEGKGLKANIGKTKMMVSGTEIAIAFSKIELCEICGKRVVSNAVCYTLCYKWMHGRCTKMKKATCSFARHFIHKRCKI